MRNFRFCLVAVVTVFALAICVYGLVRRPPMQDPGDDIIIKGGSLLITCGANHGRDCFDHVANTPLYTHKKGTSRITHITVKDYSGAVLYSGSFQPTQQPAVIVTFK